MLHRKLGELARGAGGEISKGEKTQGLRTLALAGGGAWGQGKAWEFAERVAGRIEGGVLRYSQRVALIREAEGLGIRRFDANLIIAMVQQRMGRAGVGAAEGRRGESRWWKGWGPMVGAAVGVQMAIAGVVWWVIR